MHFTFLCTGIRSTNNTNIRLKACAVWLYYHLGCRILRITRERLKETLAHDETNITCDRVIYAVELLSAGVVDWKTPRRISDVLVEMASGFLLRKQQTDMIKKISTSAPSTVHQMIMGGGKTSVIIPRLMYEHLLKNPDGGHSARILIIQPEQLVNQCRRLVLSACRLLGTLEDDDHALGTVEVRGDKSLQYQMLRAYEPHSSHGDRVKITSHLAKSLVICDEVDSVVDPLRCDLNIPDENFKVRPDIGIRDKLVECIVHESSAEYLNGLPNSLADKIRRAKITADALKVCFCSQN